MEINTPVFVEVACGVGLALSGLALLGMKYLRGYFMPPPDGVPATRNVKNVPLRSAKSTLPATKEPETIRIDKGSRPL
jgi:hypothetical protein